MFKIFFRYPIQRIAQPCLGQHSLAGVFHFLSWFICCSFPCALRAALEEQWWIGDCRGMQGDPEPQEERARFT
jgi:hypothetical protein